MNIVIIEDEMRIARRLARMTSQYFGQDKANITLFDELQAGQRHLDKHPADLLLLDLNLNGEDGFKVLEVMASRSFHTIIVSAYTDKAINAFAYGVLDFVPKPFDEERLFQAFQRLSKDNLIAKNDLKYLAVRQAGSIRLVDVSQVRVIRASLIYSELQLCDGASVLHDKSLDALERLLPQNQFVRVHRSHIIRISDAEKLVIEPGGRYSLLLKNGEIYPVGRSRYRYLRDLLTGTTVLPKVGF